MKTNKKQNNDKKYKQMNLIKKQTFKQKQKKKQK